MYQDCVEQLELVEFDAEGSTLILLIHALKGSQGHNIMRLVTSINQQEVIILVDFGSTHNFVDNKLTIRLGL